MGGRTGEKLSRGIRDFPTPRRIRAGRCATTVAFSLVSGLGCGEEAEDRELLICRSLGTAPKIPATVVRCGY
jgi:hypothetical protein